MPLHFRIALAFIAALLVSATTVQVVAAERIGASPDRWTTHEIDEIASMRLSRLGDAPADPSNAFERSRAAAALGKRLFNDTRFSSNGSVACATCHDANRQFQDGLPVARGVATGKRRTMPIVGAAHSRWLFWDGRKDSLWSQALGPLEDAAEHGGNRTRFVHLVAQHYQADYEGIFGPLPDLQSAPTDAGPLGTPIERAAWDRIDARLQYEISRTFANLGKAIAAYERTIRFGESRFDRYAQGLVDGDVQSQAALTSEEVRGLRLFIGKGQCSTCHSGPLLSDQSFHNTGVLARDRSAPDRGRVAAVAKVQHDEFNCAGPFSDASIEQCDELRFMVSDDPGLEGAFRTPSLRNVALRAPYMHAGQFSTLDDVIGHYVQAPAAAIGHSELAHRGSRHDERKPIRLSPAEVKDLVAFLQALTGPIGQSAP